MKTCITTRHLCFSFRAVAILLAGFIAGALNTQAAVWTNIVSGNASGTWSAVANWSPNIVPNAQDAIADFSTLTITTNSFVTNDAPVSVGTLVFANSTANGKTWTLDGAGGNLITLDASSGIPTIGVTNVQALVGGISGSLGFVKTGNGALAIYGKTYGNSLSGPIFVNGGLLGTVNGASFANISSDIIVANGASFEALANFDGTIFYNNFYLSGSGGTPGGYFANAVTPDGAYNGGPQPMGALDIHGNTTLSGTITLAADAKITHGYNNATINGPITVTNAGQNLELAVTVSGQPALAVNGAINLGTGSLTISGSSGVGPVVLSGGFSGVNTYAGGTIINGGKLVLAYGYPYTMDTTSGLTVNSGGILDLNGNSETLPFLAGSSGTITDNNIVGGATALTVNQSTNTTFGGAIANGALATLSLTKQGAGSLTLGGMSTYSGPTTVSAGSLVFNSGAGCSNSVVEVADGATNGYTATLPGGQWTCAGLTHDAGNTYFTFDLTTKTVDPTYQPMMQVNGDVNLNGAVHFIITNGIWLYTGTYRLVSYTGNFSSAATPTNLLVLPAGLSATITNDTASKLISLVVTHIPVVVLPGITNGVWTSLAYTNAAATNRVWGITNNWSGGLIASGASATADFTTVNIATNSFITNDAPRSIGSMLFGPMPSGKYWIVDATNNHITFDSLTTATPVVQVNSGQALLAGISGSIGLIKNGNGGLAIYGKNSANALTGPIAVNGGMLSTVNGKAFANITGTITVAAGACFSANAAFDGTTFANTIYLSGTGGGASGLASATTPDGSYSTSTTYGALDVYGNGSLSGSINLNTDSKITHSFNNGNISGPIIATGAGKNLQLVTTVSGQPNLTLNGSMSLGTGALTITGVGTQGVSLNRSNNFSGGTFLTAGVLQLGNTNALGSGALAISGGVFNLNTNNISLSSLSATAGLITDYITNAGTTTLTVNQAGSTTVAATIAITNSPTARSIALTMAGPGSLSLSATNTYSGPTTVSAGQLIGVTGGSCSNTVIEIANGATNGVQLATAGGRWACGGLNYDASGNEYIKFDLGSFAPSASVAPLYVNGSVAFNGTVTVLIPNGLWSGSGSYPLITASGAISGTTPTVVLPPHVSGNLQVIGSTLYLNVTGATQPIKWAVGNSFWNISITPNWLDASSAVTTYQETSAGDSVVFDDTATGATPITVTLNTNVIPANIIANNTNKDYILSGSGIIGGGGSLTKNGNGKLTLTTTNTYGGGTTVNAGTLLVTNGGTLGSTSAALTLAGGTLDLGGSSQTVGVATLGGSLRNGTLTATAYNGLSNTVSAVLAGANVALNKTTTGTLTLSATNTYTGGTTVSAGTLQLGANNPLGPNSVTGAGGTLDLNGFTLTNALTFTVAGAIIANYNSGAPGTMNGNIIISAGYAGFNANSGQTMVVNGKITGNVITKNNSGLVILNGTNSNSGKTELLGGTLRANEGIGLSSGAWLRIGGNGGSSVFETGTNLTRPLLATNSDSGYSTFTVSIQGGVSGFSAYGSPVTIAIGGLATPTPLVWGTPGFSQTTLVLNEITANTNLIFANTMDLNGTNRTVNVNASVATVSSVISNSTGTAGLAKGGAGKLVLTNLNTYNGATTISAGTLALSGVGSIVNTSLISVGNGATFDVSGLNSTYVLGSSQTLSNGASSTGSIKGNLNATGKTVSVSYTNGTPALAVTSGTLTLSAATVFNIDNTGPALTAGSYLIVSTNGGGLVGGTAPSVVTVTDGGLAAGSTASLSISGGQMNLVVTSSAVTPPSILPVYPDGTGTNLVLRVGTVAGHNYLLESTTNLTPPISWITNSTTVGTGGTITNTVPITHTPPNQFFRYFIQ